MSPCHPVNSGLVIALSGEMTVLAEAGKDFALVPLLFWGSKSRSSVSELEVKLEAVPAEAATTDGTTFFG